MTYLLFQRFTSFGSFEGSATQGARLKVARKGPFKLGSPQLMVAFPAPMTFIHTPPPLVEITRPSRVGGALRPVAVFGEGGCSKPIKIPVIPSPLRSVNVNVPPQALVSSWFRRAKKIASWNRKLPNLV